MSRGYYSVGKRQRDQLKAEKKREKEARRWERRERSPSEPELVTAEDIVGELPSIDEAMQNTPLAQLDSSRDRSSAAIPARLFVGGLSWDTTSASLRKCFERFGPVLNANVVHDRDTGRSRGFGFVEMANRKDASGVISSLDGSELDGRYIRVNLATERSRRAA